jgi:hypothetical protein
MNRLSRRARTAVGRGLAKADTWAAVLALWLSGMLSADDRWVGAAVAGLVGLVFLVSAGDYCWRKGFVSGQHDPSKK